MIRKQCLLNRLNNSSPRYFNIEDQLNCIKDFDLYIQKKKDQKRLRDIKEQIEMKKKVIMEHLKTMEHTRKNSLIEEEILKESVYKLNQLKKKKKTVERIVQKVENDTKILKTLKTFPNNIVNYGSKHSDWERKVLIYASELPPESEFETIFSRMEELVKSSQLPPLPSWDRTETLTEMEKVLNSKLNVLNNKKLVSVEIDKELKNLVNILIEILDQEGNVNVDEFKLLLNEFQERVMKEAVEVGRGLSVSKTPYVLESEQHTIRRFMHLIDGKTRDLNKLLPADVGDCCASDLPNASSSDLSLLVRPPAKKLVDSIVREVECFLELNLRQNLPDHIVDYVKPSISGYHQLLQFNNEVMMRSKLMNLEEKIRSLNLPIGDAASDYADFPNKIDELNSCLSEEMILVKNETEMLDKVYNRVKAGFNFLRKEPLNESLTGLQINDKDVNYWLNRYIFAKKKHDHELWLLDNQ
ncbi:uncharacterized protein MAL8P1.12-like isoform X2 [Halyomorpha halys]|uniref:uncharacterized protein MAL8P1.12-like isoform X2 n=2 Tax=Halyomorpha halys TaxID=286706 RepID=UPI0034D23E9F